MTDQLITYSTAELAAEKGFEVQTERGYRPDDGRLSDIHTWDHYSAPTQSLLQRWLREKHYIFVNVQPVIYAGDVHPSYFHPTINNCTIRTGLRFATWEECLEAGLYEALKLIS